MKSIHSLGGCLCLTLTLGPMVARSASGAMPTCRQGSSPAGDEDWLAQAKEAYDGLLKLPQLYQFGGVYWVSLYDRARIALREGDVPLAIELLKKGSRIVSRYL